LSARVSALCELEVDGRFDPTLVLFSADGTLVLAGAPGQLQMFDVATGALRWRLAVPWWEVFELDAATMVCVTSEAGIDPAIELIDVRSGTTRTRTAIDRKLDPPTAAIERGAPRVFAANAILPIEPGRRVSSATVRPYFSIDPAAHARLWPRKVAREELFLALSHAGAILQGFVSLRGGRSWRPTQRLTMLATINQSSVLVATRDAIPAVLVLVDASTGKDLLSWVLPTQQAEAIVSAAVDPSESRIALGTSLGRAIVLSVLRD
jgi:hypothetical protein